MAEEVNEDLKWQSNSLGDAKGLQTFFDDLENAIEVNTLALNALKTSYEAAKLLALTAANPITAALGLLIDEIDKTLQDLENAGIFYLTVNEVFSTTSPSKSFYQTLIAQEEKEVLAYFNYRGQIVGSINGKTVLAHPPYGTVKDDQKLYFVTDTIPSKTISGNQCGAAKDSAGDNIFKLVPAFGPDSEASGHTINSTTGLKEMTPTQVINTMIAAFSDQGDVRQQFLNDEGEIVPEVRAGRDPITGSKKFKYVDNKPTFSDTSLMGGVALIFGSTNVNGFTRLVNNIRNLFNFSEFDGLGDELLKLLAPPTITVNVQDVHAISLTPSGIVDVPLRQTQSWTERFDALKDGEKIVVTELTSSSTRSQQSGFEAEIVKVENKITPQIFMEINGEPKNVNGTPITYYEERLTLQPLNYGIRTPQPGNILVESVKKVNNEEVQTDEDIDVTEEKSGAKFKKAGELGEDPKDEEFLDNADFSWVQKVPGVDDPVQVCRVRYRQKKPKSVPPNFRSYTLGKMFPILGQGISQTRGALSRFKATLKKPSQMIQATITRIDKQVKELENIATTIISIQQAFLALRDIGFYHIIIDPQEGGTAKFLENLSGASDRPPDSLKFSSGILIVAGTPEQKSEESIKSAHALLKSLLDGSDPFNV